MSTNGVMHRYKGYLKGAAYIRMGPQPAKYGDACTMCRKKFSEGDVAMFMGEGNNPKKFHRVCLKKYLEASYEILPAGALEMAQDELGGMVDATGSRLFEHYRNKVADQLGIET